MIIVCHLSLFIGYATEINGHFCEKYFSCVIEGNGRVTTQRWGAILGNRSKRLENTGLILIVRYLRLIRCSFEFFCNTLFNSR